MKAQETNRPYDILPHGTQVVTGLARLARQVLLG
jgi:hypothetical protein